MPSRTTNFHPYLAVMCLIICALISETAWATSIVLYKVGDRVFVAADSKFVTGDNQPAGFGCKVVELERNVFFAHARVLSIPGTGVDVADIAKQAFSKPGTIFDRITKFEQAAYPALAGVMEAVQRGDPAGFKTSQSASGVVYTNGNLTGEKAIFNAR